MQINSLKLCLVTHIGTRSLDEYLQFILLAVQGGVTSVQFRDKTNSISTLNIALALKALLSPLQIPLIINDNVMLAKEVDAEGVHLGQTDTSPVEARQLLGETKLIGLSIETEAQLQQANQLNCIDYVAASAIFPSKTKQDCKTIWGLEGLRRLSQLSTHPVIAIGGIDIHNIQHVIQHGASGIALVSAIHDHPHPDKAAKALIHQIHQGMNHVRTH